VAATSCTFDLTEPSAADRWAVSAAAIAHCCCWLLLLLLPPAGMIARNLDMMRVGNMLYV
jgi:cytochrome b561